MTGQDTIVIGGGVIGLATALSLSRAGQRVALFDRSFIPNPLAASGGKTRSIRRDYLDPLYASLAVQAQGMWKCFEEEAGECFYEQCGLVNLADTRFTPDLAQSYAVRSVVSAGLKPLDSAELLPTFQSEYTSFDASGGVLRLPAIMEFLKNACVRAGVMLHENAPLQSVESESGVYIVNENMQAENLVLTPGCGINPVLSLLPGPEIRMPVTLMRPQEVRYYEIPPADTERFSKDQLPVFACLDISVYGHPIMPGLCPWVKVSNYILPGDPQPDFGSKTSIDVFIETFMPELEGMAWRPVEDTDLCQYDYTGDCDFILGPVPGYERLWMFGGGNGTAFKFAPLIGQILGDAVMKGSLPAFCERFSPMRFN